MSKLLKATLAVLLYLALWQTLQQQQQQLFLLLPAWHLSPTCNQCMAMIH
jgi:hypothetical protein